MLAAAIGGCANDPLDFNRPPALNGRGLRSARRSRAVAGRAHTSAHLPPGQLCSGRIRALDLFKDPRARKIGDVATVKISIKDKATLDNNSKRSRDAKNEFKPELTYDINVGQKTARVTRTSTRRSIPRRRPDSKGGITRSESIDLLIAAVVTGVLPNGNLIVSGSQEVRVNFEIRELSVAGIVRPRDISTDNTVAYDKIAEARISYGGRGRISEVQQPAGANSSSIC